MVGLGNTEFIPAVHLLVGGHTVETTATSVLGDTGGSAVSSDFHAAAAVEPAAVAIVEGALK
jgi:hypothetical protein